MLEIPDVRARVSPVTGAQDHQFPEVNENGRRNKLIRGVTLEKISKLPLHSGIASALYDLLDLEVAPGFWLRKEEPLTLRDSEPEDRSLAALYAEANVEQYRIMLPVERRVEDHRLRENGAYLDHSMAEGDATLECHIVPAIRLRLAELFT